MPRTTEAQSIREYLKALRGYRRALATLLTQGDREIAAAGKVLRNLSLNRRKRTRTEGSNY